MASAQSHPFGGLLRRSRLAAGLTQEELAERAGLSTRAISDLERGVNRTPQPATLLLLAEALRLSDEERARFETTARWRGAAPGRVSGLSPQDISPSDHPDQPVPLAAVQSLVAQPPPPVKPPVPLRKWIKRPSGIHRALLIGLVVVLSTAGLLGSLSLLTHFGVFGTPSGSTTPPPVRGGTWTDDLQKDPTSLLPNGGGDAFDSNTLVDQALYLPLFYGDDHGRIHPGAATEVPTLTNGGINAGATIWTFHLRPGLVWSDGQPYDARDVDYTWRLWSDPAFAFWGDFPLTNGPVGYQLIRSATVSPDHLSITFHLTQPFAPFLTCWVDGVQAPLPAHHFSTMTPGQLENSPDNLNPTVTSGPFLLRESQPGDHYTLGRNPRYYLAGQGLPYLDKLVFRIAGSDATILQDFQAGAVDSTQLARNRITLQAYQQINSYRLVTAPTSAQFEALFFNFHNTVLATHLEVREAIARAIDHQALIQGPLHGFATPLCTDHPSALHPGYQAGAYCPAFDEAAANKVLDDAGWVRGPDGVRARDGQRLEFEYSTGANDDWRNAVQLLVQQDLLGIGIKLDIQNYPSHQFFHSILGAGEASPPTGAVAGKFDIAELGWVYGYDPDDSAFLACDQTPPTGANSAGENFGSYCNPALDAQIQQELATPDPGLRQNTFDQMHLIEVTDFPFIVLFSPLRVTVVHKGTHNDAPSPMTGETINVWEWWCDQGKC